MGIKLRKCFTLLIFTALCSFSHMGLSASYAEDHVDNDLNAWQSVVLQVPIGERWQLNTLSQMREKNHISDADRFLQFADINYYLDKEKHWAAGVGYAWTPSYPFRNENRVYEQVSFQHPLKGGQLFIRNRLEQRFIKDAAETANWNRTLVQYSHPIADSGWYWVVSDEAFEQLYSVHNGPKGGFDNNRAYAGLGKNVSKHVRLEGGYMLLWAHHSGSEPEGLNHTLMTQLVIH